MHLLKERKTSVLDINRIFVSPNLKELNQISLGKGPVGLDWPEEDLQINKAASSSSNTLSLEDYSILDMSRINQQMLRLFFQPLAKVTVKMAVFQLLQSAAQVTFNRDRSR